MSRAVKDIQVIGVREIGRLPYISKAKMMKIFEMSLSTATRRIADLDRYVQSGRYGPWLMNVIKTQGMEAAEKELKVRGAMFVPLEVNQKQLDEAVYKIKLNTIDCILIMSCMVLRDEFDFGQKRLERFCERFNLKTDALCDEEIMAERIYARWQYT